MVSSWYIIRKEGPRMNTTVAIVVVAVVAVVVIAGVIIKKRKG